jgi:DNA-binding XRE family transcriptional regulator
MTSRELKRIRRELDITQGELAKRIGAARGTVNRWERGDGKTMHPVFARQIKELDRQNKGAA